MKLRLAREVEQLLCKMCNSKLVEDELYFFTACPTYQNLRIDLLLTTRAETLDSEVQFTKIMSNEGITTVALLAKFLFGANTDSETCNHPQIEARLHASHSQTGARLHAIHPKIGARLHASASGVLGEGTGPLPFCQRLSTKSKEKMLWGGRPWF